MTGAHNFIRFYTLVAPAQRISRTLTLCLQLPIVITTMWGQLAGKTMTVHPRSLLLYCTAMFVYVYQTLAFPLHCGDNVKVKIQHIYQSMDIPVLIRGSDEAVVTNDWRIIYSPCANPESFARGGPILQRFFFFFFFFLWGGGDECLLGSFVIFGDPDPYC